MSENLGDTLFWLTL